MNELSNLRIVFMGTPHFAVHVLEGMLAKGCQVVGVITAPDKPAGRGQKIRISDVKQFALTRKIPVLQPHNLKSPDFLSELERLKPDLQVVVAFRMLPKIVWELPPKGTFNLHASLLPNYRGAAPINWAIINGEKETGVTTFFIDEKIDTGAIIQQSKVIIDDEDNAGTLHDKLMQVGSQLVNETIDLIIENNVQTIVQNNGDSLKTAHKLHKENCRIDWQKSAMEISNLVRGLTPYPGAWGLLKNGEDQYNVKISKIEIEIENHDLPIGRLVSNKSSIKIAVNNGFVNLLWFKFPGKKQMDCQSFLNGFTFHSEAHML